MIHILFLHETGSNNPNPIGLLEPVISWGQISFWGTTVITNLLSANPYLGIDFHLLLLGKCTQSNEHFHIMNYRLIRSSNANVIIKH